MVYDRLWTIVLQQLQAERNDSDANVANERVVFLAAVQRIEFGERLPAPADRRAETVQAERRPRRRMLWPIAGRMAGACAVLLIVWFAYLVVRLDSASAARWAGESAPNSWQAQIMRTVLSIHNLIEKRSVTAPIAGQRAVLYEESAATATGTTFSGHAVWRRHSASTAAGADALSIDVEIPQRSFVVKISLRRAPDGGGVISHFVEFRFLTSDLSPSDAVEDVVGILMKNDELSRGIELAGKVVRVQPGVFLMGLSGAEADIGRNLKLLRERPWLDIPIVMKDRSRSILAIEKGSTGQNAVNQALVSWGQT